jgi:hypothetical protein
VSFRFFKQTIAILTSLSDTNGVVGAVEVAGPGGAVPPLHVHHREHEAFYVLQGEYSAFIGDDVITASPGTWVWGPRDVPHGTASSSSGPRQRRPDRRPWDSQGLPHASDYRRCHRRLPRLPGNAGGAPRGSHGSASVVLGGSWHQVVGGEDGEAAGDDIVGEGLVVLEEVAGPSFSGPRFHVGI